MFTFDERQWQRWLIPLLSSAVLFAVLLLFFPFDSGYTTARDPLGLALWSTWTSQDPNAQDYSYCLLVPFIVGFIIYERRSQLARAPVQGVNAALFAILLGLLIFWVGSRAGKQFIGCGAIQILLAGFVYWIWGRSVFRILLFAWAMIAFAWPLPFLDTAVAFPLRMTVSHTAFHVLNFIGIPSIQNGTALYSAPNPTAGLRMGDRFQIDIADPCSGLHSLLPLLMFSACYSYFFLRRLWQQWLVFFSALPFTIVGNVCRILLLVTGCLKWGTPFALGTNEKPSWYHEDCGYAVFAVVLGLECLLGFLLIASERRISVSSKSTAKEPKLPPETPTPANAENSPVSPSQIAPVPFWRSGIMLGLAAMMVVVAWNHPPPALSPEAGVLTDLPERVHLTNLDGGDFFGDPAEVSKAEHTFLPKDTIFSRKNYQDFHGHNIFFSIVLSGLQEYTIHPPQVCLVAQGWSIVHEENVPVPLSSGHEMVVRNLSIQREETDANKVSHLIHAYYMYWYVTDGISTPSRDERNWVSSWDRVFHNRDHRWAYVIAMSPITEDLRPDGLNPDQTRKMLTDFIREIVPTFQKSEMSGLGKN